MWPSEHQVYSFIQQQIKSTEHVGRGLGGVESRPSSFPHPSIWVTHVPCHFRNQESSWRSCHSIPFPQFSSEFNLNSKNTVLLNNHHATRIRPQIGKHQNQSSQLIQLSNIKHWILAQCQNPHVPTTFLYLSSKFFSRPQGALRLAGNPSNIPSSLSATYAKMY